MSRESRRVLETPMEKKAGDEFVKNERKTSDSSATPYTPTTSSNKGRRSKKRGHPCPSVEPLVKASPLPPSSGSDFSVTCKQRSEKFDNLTVSDDVNEVKLIQRKVDATLYDTNLKKTAQERAKAAVDHEKKSPVDMGDDTLKGVESLQMEFPDQPTKKTSETLVTQKMTITRSEKRTQEHSDYVGHRKLSPGTKQEVNLYAI
ncbi:unnamed protein product [Caenorhabditis auriculariae]|uniref:Uncharacterized protein n=1 Tax=Caenorhabditis auriculariae TaxID=2777116 RepID=A0A8S1HJI6_9PELO|nr:unnamed protein product [Caenorhabditis auriculariae]